MARRGVALFTVIVIAAGAWMALFDMYGPAGRTAFVDVPRGMSARQVGRLLAETGVIRSEWQFLAVRAARPRVKLHAGEYEFSHPDTPWHIFQRMAVGDIHFYQLTVPEGSNLFDICAGLERLGLMKDGGFLTVARRPEMVHELLADIAPGAPTLEGFLFPATYRITRQTTPEKLARDMVQQFRRVYTSLNGPLPAIPAVTLASIVEKESAIPVERPLVASVYANRVAKGMKLDCDPTTIYAALLEGRWRGTIYRSDLDSKSPFNTYQHAGLPPGPIANPGRDALAAALHPAPTKYLYFVARPDGSGRHVFSEGLAEHTRAVAQYRRGHQKAVAANSAAGTPGRAKPPHHR